MKVSVIIPFHRGLSFLEDCLQSLAEQSYEDMETIIACDHAEEDVKTFIAPYVTQLRIKLVYLQDKTGVAAARNLGLSNAVGEYVYFLDSDDYIDFSTLSLLISSAEENNADMIYGRMLWTMVKRSVFMENFNIEESENTEEDGEEDNNSGASAGDGENGGSAKEDQLLSDDEEEKEPDEIESASDPEVRKKSAYYHLITQHKGVRNISVLNVLIRRSLIEDNNLRFHDGIIYLSDYPFLLQLLTAAQSFDYQPRAVYIKRTHNDPARMPSLSQNKGSKSFQEYVKAYRYAISLIDPNGELRKRIDRKVIDYCIRFFAPKLIETEKVALREKRFKIMHQLISEMDQSIILKQKGYRRKLLRAFYEDDINRARVVVKRHFNWKKFKKTIKYKRAFSKFLYFRFFLKKSVKQNWVFCESFFGKSYSDSPKYVYEYISKNYPGQFRFIWVIDKKRARIPYKHTRVKRFSIRYVYYLARCKYYIFNGRQQEWIKKRKGNVFLQTWHGTPLKRLVFDREDLSTATQEYKRQTYNQSRAWDYLIAPNKFSSDIFRSCFKYDKEMLETGYPRNDILHAPNREQIALDIKEKLKLPSNKKVILYAPTWRDDEYYIRGQYKFTLMLDLNLMKEKLGKDYVILLRTHYFIADSLNVTGLGDFAFNMSNYDDISELYLISDILITDYSSVFFDYANLKRPMLFFTYDLEKYRDVLRGFYIDIEEELPGPLLFTTEEVITAINQIDMLQQQYHQKYLAFYEKYCSWEDGNASRRVAEAVFKLKGI